MRRSPIIRKPTDPRKRGTVASRKRRRTKRSEKARKDAEARAVVMERDHYKCQLAGGMGPTCSKQMQWCHIKSRRYLATRWRPENALALCAAHHRWSHDNPDEFIPWWEREFPDRAVAVRRALMESLGRVLTTGKE